MNLNECFSEAEFFIPPSLHIPDENEEFCYAPPSTPINATLRTINAITDEKICRPEIISPIYQIGNCRLASQWANSYSIPSHF